MPAITAGFSFRVPSFIISSAPHLCLQWSSSLRLSRKPDGFEAPVLIPWKDKIMYKFIVDGRWMTNDTQPTEIDHGFVNNVYTAPSKPPVPEPQHAVVPPSYHNESEVEPEHVEKVPRHADKPVVNGSALGEPHEAPIPITGPAPEKSSTIPDKVKQVVTLAVVAPLAETAQVVPEPQEVERASEEVRLNPIC
jgi:Glycogen recognition site of AMP-activated protein kinase